MSKNKKKNSKSSAKSASKLIKSEQKSEVKKPVKGIIIAAVALLLVAAVVLTVVLIKKNNDTDNGDVTKPIVTLGNDGGQYTYAEYKGSSLPVEFVEVLNQAEADSNAALKKYGAALELGDREISMPEFVLYYYDQISLQNQKVEYAIQQTGENRTGYDKSVLPNDQKALGEDYTWAEKFTLDAIDVMTEIYAKFDSALKAGTKLDVMTVSTTISNYNRIDTYGQSDGKTIDQLLVEVYCEGLTPAMFKAREIMIAYADRYEIEKKSELQNGYTDAEIEAKFNEDKNAYSRIIGRVYPIEGEYIESVVSKIKTEQEFLDYAQSNSPYEDYNAEVRTRCNLIDREKISSVYGQEVGEWMFSDERKAGDIAVVEGMLYKYLVYIEKTPFLTTSCNVITYISEYDETMTDEDKAELFKTAQTLYDEWKAGGSKKEDFVNMSLESGGQGEITARVEEYYYQVGEWMFDSSRKPGDNVLIDTEVGCCMVYYVGNNEDDYDWKANIPKDMGSEEYENMYESNVRRNYFSKRNEKIMDTAYDEVNERLEKKMENSES